MPSWGMHLLTAKKISEKIDVDKNLFFIGNILPDINNGYVIPKVSCIIPHQVTHHAILKIIQGQKEYLSGSDIFAKKYKDDLENPMILGYLTHLLTDSYWNAITYIKYGMINEMGERIGIRLNTGEELLCSREEARVMKTNDFKIFSGYLYQEQLVEAPFYIDDINKEIKKIEEVSLSNQDIKKAIRYIEDNVQGKTQIQKNLEEKQLKIYTGEKLKQNIDESVEYIVNFLDESKKSL